jgi:beta-glucosidase
MQDQRNTDMNAKIDALLSQMSPEEKAGQVQQFFHFGGVEDVISPEVAAGRVGSLLFVRDAAEINRMQKIAVEESRLKIPLLFGFDVIHGLRTIFPVPIAMAASWDMTIIEESQAVAARESRAIGLHWTFAPMVDIARDPRWGRMIEGAGEDSYLGSAVAVAQVRGFQGDAIGQEGRIIAGPKHLVGYGAAMGGRDYDEAEISDSQLHNVYLPPFKAAIDAGAGNIMCAYMSLNGVPPTGNHWLLRDVLKGEWGFEGFTVSDANSAFDLCTHNFAADPKDAAVRALHAGLDMEMSLTLDEAAFRHIPAALAAGELDEAALDDAVRRILAAKFKMGLFENPYVDLNAVDAVLNDPAHREVARVAAEKSFVLVRNEGNVLPLSADMLASVAVIGPLADAARDTLGPWVFEHDNAETVTVLAGIKAALGDAATVQYSPGVSMIPRTNGSFFDTLPGFDTAPLITVDDDAEIANAVALAQQSDVAILVLGEAQNMIGEAASRSALHLPGRQQDLLEAVIATGKPVVLLLMAARPIDLKGATPDAIMTIWYPGSQGGAAVANVLFGDVAPGGKLPFNWVRNVGQIPLPYGRSKTHKPKDRDTRYWNEAGDALYPFGHGLGYADFAYANVRTEKSIYAPGEDVTVTTQVTNTGSRTADDVAQLYIYQHHGSATRPIRELKGFERFTLFAGETRTVTFTLTAADLSYWSSASRRWVQEETTFDLFVGTNSRADLQTKITIKKL